MNEHSCPSRYSRVGPRLLAGIAGILGLCAAGTWLGCSIERDHEMLSFFFDGVPDPHSADYLDGVFAKLPRMKHKPFAEQQCRECHSSGPRVKDLTSSLCLKCHEDRVEEFPRMHGPVAAVACLICHSPHESVYPSLLRAEPYALCTQCHDESLLNTQVVAAHSDPTRSCIECHSGHGGADTFFLHEDLAPADLERAIQSVDQERER